MNALRTLIETHVIRDQNKNVAGGEGEQKQDSTRDPKPPQSARSKVSDGAKAKAAAASKLATVPEPISTPAPTIALGLAPASDLAGKCADTGANGAEAAPGGQEAREAVAAGSPHANGDSTAGNFCNRESMASNIAQDRLRKRGAASSKPSTARAGAARTAQPPSSRAT